MAAPHRQVELQRLRDDVPAVPLFCKILTTLAFPQFSIRLVSMNPRNTKAIQWEILCDDVRTKVFHDQRAWFGRLATPVRETGEIHFSAHMFKLVVRL